MLKKLLSSLSLVLVVLALLASTTLAQTYYSTVYVSPTNGTVGNTGQNEFNNPAGTGPVTSINAGLALVQNGGTLIILADIYPVAVDINTATYTQITSGITIQVSPLRDPLLNVINSIVTLNTNLTFNVVGGTLNVTTGTPAAVLAQTGNVTLTAGNINLSAASVWTIASGSLITLNGTSIFTNAAPAKASATGNVNVTYNGGGSFSAGAESNYGSYGSGGVITINKTAGSTVTLPNNITTIGGITGTTGNAIFSGTVAMKKSDIVNNGAGALTFSNSVTFGIGDGTAASNIGTVINNTLGSVVFNSAVSWTADDITAARVFPAAGGTYVVENNSLGSILFNSTITLVADADVSTTVGNVTLTALNNGGILTLGTITADQTAAGAGGAKAAVILSVNNAVAAGTLNLAGGIIRGTLTNVSAATVNVLGATTVAGANLASNSTTAITSGSVPDGSYNVTVTTTVNPHLLLVGQPITISGTGATPAGIDGVWVITSVPAANQFVINVGSSTTYPGGGAVGAVNETISGLVNAGTINLTGAITLSGGNGSHIVTGGTITGSGRILTTNGSTVAFKGTSALGNVEIASTGIVNFVSNATGNSFTVTSGTAQVITGVTLNVVNYNQTAGTFTLGPTGSTATLNVKGNMYRTAGTFTSPTSSTVSFTGGTTAQQINPGPVFTVGILTFNNTYATITVGNSIRATGAVLNATGTVINLSSLNLILKGGTNSITNNGIINATGGGGVILGGVLTLADGLAGAGYVLAGTGIYAYVTVDVGSANTATVTPTTGVGCKWSGVLTLRSGTLAVDGTSVAPLTLDFGPSAPGAILVRYPSESNGISLVSTGTFNAANNYPYDLTYTGVLSVANPQPSVAVEVTGTYANIGTWTIQTTNAVGAVAPKILLPTAGVTFVGNLFIANTAELNLPTSGGGADKFILTGNNKTHSILGSITLVDAGDAIQINGTGVTLNGGTGSSDVATLDRFILNANASVTVKSIKSFKGTFSTGAASILTLGSDERVVGNMALGAGTVALGAFNLNFRGVSNTVDPSASITGTGALVANGQTYDQTLDAGAASSFTIPNLIINNQSDGNTLTVGSVVAQDLIVSNALTVTKGDLTINAGRQILVTGNTIALSATSSDVLGAGTLVSIPATGTLTLAPNNAVRTIPNFTVNGPTLLGAGSSTLVISTLVQNSNLDLASWNVSTPSFTRGSGINNATTGYLELTGSMSQGMGFVIPNLKISAAITPAAQALAVTKNLYLNNSVFTNGSLLSVGAASGSVPTITVEGAGNLSAAPTFAQGQVNYVLGNTAIPVTHTATGGAYAIASYSASGAPFAITATTATGGTIAMASYTATGKLFTTTGNSATATGGGGPAADGYVRIACPGHTYSNGDIVVISNNATIVGLNGTWVISGVAAGASFDIQVSGISASSSVANVNYANASPVNGAVDITTTVAHNLTTGQSVAITAAPFAAGSPYTVTYVSPTVFRITLAGVVTSAVSPANVVSYPTAGAVAGNVTCTAAGHTYSALQTIVITGNAALNGTYVITSVVAGTSFSIPLVGIGSNAGTASANYVGASTVAGMVDVTTTSANPFAATNSVTLSGTAIDAAYLVNSAPSTTLFRIPLTTVYAPVVSAPAGSKAAITGTSVGDVIFTTAIPTSIVTGNPVVIAGSASSAANGTWTATVLTPSTFKVTIAGVTAGSGTVSNIAVTNIGSSTVGTNALYWPVATVAKTLSVNYSPVLNAPSGTLITGRPVIAVGRTVKDTLNLTSGILSIASTSTNTSTLALSGVPPTIMKSSNATVALLDGTADYPGVITAPATGANLVYLTAPQTVGYEWTAITAINNVVVNAYGSASSSPFIITTGSKTILGTFTGNENVSFAPSSSTTLTLNGALTMAANKSFTIASGAVLSTLGNVTLNSGAVITGAGSLSFTGGNAQAVKLSSANSSVNNISINKSANNVTLSGGDLTANGVVTFVAGNIITGTGKLVLTAPKHGDVFGGTKISQGFTGASNASMVVGNVAKTFFNDNTVGNSTEEINRFPVGDGTNYRPIALTFNSAFGFPTVPNNITVVASYTNSTPGGAIGLPIANGVATGINIARYPSFYWGLTTSGTVSPSLVFDLEVVGAGYTNYDDVNNIRIIRRYGVGTDVANEWNLQGDAAQYDNTLNGAVPTVISKNSTGGLRTGGAVFTLGLKSNMSVKTPIAKQWLVKSATSSENRSISLADLFKGNIGTLTYAVASSNVAVATVHMQNPTSNILVVSAQGLGDCIVTVTATDATTNDFFAFSIPVNVGPTDVASTEQLPTEFALFQNFPNPFNPTTNIRFDIPKESNVTLKIYNILGEEVAKLVDKVMPAGHQSVTFDASKLASGMYIYRIQATDFVQVKKMLLMK